MITVAEKRDFQKIQIILYGIFFYYLFPWFENNMRMCLQIFHESLFFNKIAIIIENNSRIFSNFYERSFFGFFFGGGSEYKLNNI